MPALWMLLQVLDRLVVRRGPRVLLQHLAVADDGVERRAQLVAHVGEEGALGAAGGLGRVAGLDQLLLGPLPLGDLRAEFPRPVLDPLLQFVVRLLEGFVALLDLRQHVVEPLVQRADLVVAVRA